MRRLRSTLARIITTRFTVEPVYWCAPCACAHPLPLHG